MPFAKNLRSFFAFGRSAAYDTLPSVMSCNPTSPKRFPRSLHESASYDPAWRHLQVEEYLSYRRHLGDQDGPFILPTSERDSLVRAYFKFRSGVVGPKHAAFTYTHDCDDANTRTSMASRIKALTVAEVRPAEIAERLHKFAMFRQGRVLQKAALSEAASSVNFSAELYRRRGWSRRASSVRRW